MSKSLSQNDRESLDRDGFLALTGLIGVRQVAMMKSRLEELLDASTQDHAGTLIIGGLLADPVFDQAWNHPRIQDAIESVLGNEYFLVGVTSRGLRSGHGQQALHADWGGQGEPGVWYLCHAICALVDFTSENGATRVVPQSHRNPWMMKGIRDARQRHPKEVQLLGKAGTVFILNVHCLHSAVQNSSPHPRLAIFSCFSRCDSPLLVQNTHVNPTPDVLARFSETERRRLTHEFSE